MAITTTIAPAAKARTRGRRDGSGVTVATGSSSGNTVASLVAIADDVTVSVIASLASQRVDGGQPRRARRRVDAEDDADPDRDHDGADRRRDRQDHALVAELRHEDCAEDPDRDAEKPSGEAEHR